MASMKLGIIKAIEILHTTGSIRIHALQVSIQVHNKCRKLRVALLMGDAK